MTSVGCTFSLLPAKTVRTLQSPKASIKYISTKEKAYSAGINFSKSSKENLPISLKITRPYILTKFFHFNKYGCC